MLSKNSRQTIRQFLLAKIPSYPHDITALAVQKFKVSRMTVNRHLNYLVEKNEIYKTGTTKNIAYYLIDAKNKKMIFNTSQQLDEDVIWQKIKNDFDEMKTNVIDLCHYAFTEILNNAIDHSDSKKILVEINWEGVFVILKISDDGIGIFQKIKKAFNLKDEKESLLQLTKGKLTTDPTNHTGEGIFFSSRAVDDFQLESNGIIYHRDNIQNDWYVELIDQSVKGTCVVMKIDRSSTRELKSVFDQYMNQDSFEFSKTDVLVQLGQLGEENFISRSQAKRVLLGLDKFKHIILDFKDVRVVGQGFADEVFRVFQNQHPNIQISYRNTNENVEFMIKRSLNL